MTVLIVSAHPASWPVLWGPFGVQGTHGPVSWPCMVLSARRAALGGHGAQVWSTAPAAPRLVKDTREVASCIKFTEFIIYFDFSYPPFSQWG